MAEQKASPDQSASPADRYAVIADEMRGLSQDVGDSLLKVLLELRKSNSGEVYAVSKKYLEDYGFLMPDEGFVGVADRFVRGRNDEFHVCPGDVVIYAMPYTLKTDDVLLSFFLRKGSIGLYHCRLLGFNPRGSLEVYDLVDEKTHWISSKNVFGKLMKAITFGDPEWHELIGQMVTRKHLIDSMGKWIKQLEESHHPELPRRKRELERRLAILTSDRA
jgi:hypothetical protein